MLEGSYQILFQDGVPNHFIGRRFRLNQEASIVATPEGTSVLLIGCSGLSNAVGLEVDTGRVVEVIDAPGRPRLFINTSLADFVHTLVAVADRFPYYDTDAGEDEIEAVSAELLEVIRRIDPPAAEADRYWSTFIDDSLIGDLTTEAILEVTDGHNT